MIEFLPVLDFNLATYIFVLFCIMAAVQFLFLALIFSRLAFHKNRVKNPNSKGVSILIAARNESENLFKNLPFILEQDYSEFEVIVINHQSMDDSKYILDAYQREYKNLKVISLERSQHLKYGKKLPLTIGIKGAKYNQLLLTDADCKPTGNQWLKSMSSYFTSKHQIILGYGPYIKSKGLLNKVIRFDTAWIAMNYLSMAKAKIPYMGIGRNMAYTKEVFDKVNGFKSHYSISSGDDDLFIQEAAKKKNYTINLAPESFCYSTPPASWSRWIKQKSRHYTTSERYKVIKKLMLGIYPLSLLIMMISFVTLVFDSNFIWISLVIFTFILLIKWIILGRSFSKLKESKFIALLPLLDIAYAILTPIMYYAIDKTDKNKW
ncbi:MAG: glycosyltransferase [Crocinitomicaceae bacterium]|nr:glycosyltransferase [Crocinitomicaceae bacterium]